MKKYIFPSIPHMISQIISMMNLPSSRCQGINIVAGYALLCSILNDIVKNSDYQICNIKLSDSGVDGYTGEYILSISDKRIWCEEAKNGNEYLYVDGITTFVHSDCNSAFVIKNKGQPMIEFEFLDEEER